MTLKEFTKLSITKQSDAVFETSVRISDLSDGKYMYVLFSLYSFYIERRYEIESGNLVYISAFESDCKRLDLYLNDIDISVLN
jgi:hypothetical protein